MIGKYDITLYNNKVHYHLLIERNITVLRGDSASGKTELIRLLTAYNSNPTSSGITLICEKKCSVLTEENWKLFTEAYTDRIFFIDEGNSFLKTKLFAETVKGADNYFVVISREKLSQLLYSIDEVYGLREDADSGRYHNPKRLYNGMYRVFGKRPEPSALPDMIITEDSNSGNDFFSILFPDRCISSNGKSNIKNVIARYSGQKILAVVDGAAFGPEMQDCMDISASMGGEIALYAPESFEFLILQSGIIEIPKAVTAETWNYADSVRYFSWEEFYTAFLSEETRNSISQYSKAKLSAYYRTAGNIEKIKNTLPKCMQEWSRGTVPPDHF